MPHYIFNGRSPYYRSSTSGLCVLQYSKRFLISALRQIFSGFSPSGNFRDQTISKNIKSTVAYFIVVIKLFKSLRVNGIVIVFTEPQASTDSELYLKKRRLFSPIGEQSVQTSIAFVFLTHRIMMTEHPTNLTDTL